VLFCWTIWDDEKIAHMESITHLVSLFYLIIKIEE